MQPPPTLVHVWRGDILECQHNGDWVIATADGQIVDGDGDASKLVLPRSSLKPLQAVPLVESGAAKAFGLGLPEIALSAASHQGAPMHTDPVRKWLASIDRTMDDLRCGSQPPATDEDRDSLVRANQCADPTHNNCSGKHTGFLTLSKHISAGPEYIDPHHPVQQAVRTAVEELTMAPTEGHAIDGCSAPNFAVRLEGLARAMAKIAVAQDDESNARARALFEIRTAMSAYPELVAGEGRACTRLMRLLPKGSIVKTGAEGVFVAALPSLGLGVALKIADGATRASEVTMTAILLRLGVLDADNPDVMDLLRPKITNWRGTVVGHISPVGGLAQSD